MGTEVAPEDKELPKCGRLVFRGVELAYLNIGGEFMLPLAELLALVLPSTPRTTLFTRMEKMKVRRHFCQPEEIKLLKTVNGIHGSSANCTLLSKTEVDKYCSMYIDNLSESNKGKSTEHNTNDSKIANEQRRADNCKAKVDIESVHRNNNEIPNKLTVLHKHKKSSPLKAKLKLTKVANAVKLKSALSSDSLFNQTLTDSASRQTTDLKCASVNELGEGTLPVSSQSFCSSHTSNFAQTLPVLANNKRLKKRDKNLNSEANKKGNSSRAKKRLSNDEQIRQEFETPLKIPKRSEIHGHRKENNKISDTSNEFQPVCSLQASQKQDVDFLGVSDASSIDSGFASTALSNASSPTKTDFSTGELSGLLKKDEEAIREHEHSPFRPPKLKTPTKIKGRGNEGKSLTLSPPALVLKRYEDSWQVEQKSPVKEVVNCLHKSKVKSKEKAREVGLTRSLFQETCGKAQHIKQVKKRRKSRKPLDLREEISITNDLDVEEKTDVSGRKKKKGKQKGKLVGGEKSSDFSTAKETKTERLSQGKESSRTQLNDKQQSKQELLKKEAVLERLVGDALTKFFGPKTSTSDSTPSTSSNTPTKPISKKPKVAGTKKPVLKTNSNFKLLNLFPVTSQLALQDGSLCPVFTMSCPKGVRPLSSHPLWKWRLGQPVVQDSAQTFLKPAPVTKPKKAQSSCTTKVISNKVQTLKRKRRKRLPTKGKVPLGSSTVSLSVCANATVCTDLKVNQNVSTGLDECSEVCNAASVNAVASSAEITVN